MICVPFKPRDIVRTPQARVAKVLELLPRHRRLVIYLDGAREYAEFPVEDLALIATGAVRPWASHVLERRPG